MCGKHSVESGRGILSTNAILRPGRGRVEVEPPRPPPQPGEAGPTHLTFGSRLGGQVCQVNRGQ